MLFIVFFILIYWTHFAVYNFLLIIMSAVFSFSQVLGCLFSGWIKWIFFSFRVDDLLREALPRVAKLGIKVGLRLIGSVKTGSVYDGTCVTSAQDVDVLVMFNSYQVKP